MLLILFISKLPTKEKILFMLYIISYFLQKYFYYYKEKKKENNTKISKFVRKFKG